MKVSFFFLFFILVVLSLIAVEKVQGQEGEDQVASFDPEPTSEEFPETIEFEIPSVSGEEVREEVHKIDYCNINHISFKL